MIIIVIIFAGTIIFIMSVQYAGTLPSTNVIVTVDGGRGKDTDIVIERLSDLHSSSQSAVQSSSQQTTTPLSRGRVQRRGVCDHRNGILALGTEEPNQIIIGAVDHVSLEFNVTQSILFEVDPWRVAFNKDGSKLAVLLGDGLLPLTK